MAFIEIHGLKLADNSYIKNLVVESLASDPIPAEAGRIWFNTTEKQYKASTLNTGGAVVIQVLGGKEELDAFIANLASTDSGKGSALIGYAGKTGTNGEFSIAAGTGQATLDAIVTGIDSTKKALADLGTGSIETIQNELDATQVGAGLNTTGAYITPTGNYINTATSLADADSKLDTAVKATSDAVATEATARADADALKVSKSGDSMTGALSMTDNRITNVATPTDDQDAANKIYVDTVVQGLDWKDSVVVASTENLTLSGTQTVDGVVLVVGDRVLVKSQTVASENGLYDVTATAWTRSTDADGNPTSEISNGLAVFVAEGTINGGNGYVLTTPDPIVVGTTELDFTQFSGAGNIIAGAGISKNGNEIYLNFGAGIVELPSDEIGIDVYSSGGIFTTTDGETESTVAGAKIAIKLDGTTIVKGANGIKVNDTLLSGITDSVTTVSNELGVTQTGAGLETDGTYVANGSANYISTATSLKNADTKLDTAIKANETAISTESTDRANADTAIQTELDDTQAGAGLSASGAYVAPASNYITASTSIKNATVLLDSQLKTTADALAQEVIDRGTAVSAVISAVNGNTFTFESSVAATSHVINHNLASPFVTVALWIKQDDGSYTNDIAQVTLTNNSSLTVDLTVAKNIRIVVTAPTDL